MKVKCDTHNIVYGVMLSHCASLIKKWNEKKNVQGIKLIIMKVRRAKTTKLINYKQDWFAWRESSQQPIMVMVFFVFNFYTTYIESNIIKDAVQMRY